MRIFLAGGTGLIGIHLIPQLLGRGHEVTATTRRPTAVDRLTALGARGVVVDVYDADALARTVAEAEPDVVLHELTDLSEADTAANARLRREGTAHLVDAARSAGVDRMVVQSIAWVFPDGPAPAAEDDPIVPGTAVDEMERTVRGLPHATVLRYGMLYGPGTWYEPGGRVARAVAAGQVPATPAITCFVHLDDVVTATVQALDWPDGVYHVVDDEPAEGAAWLPVYAAGIGAPAPPHEPLPAGAPAGRAVSNARAKAAGMVLAHPTWREGFPRVAPPTSPRTSA
jgi:nucleoside-diphosphate-sugar epimerase